MIPSNIFPDMPIRPWEWGALAFYLIAIYIIASLVKRRNVNFHPEYKFYIWGLWAKVFGGLGFAMIYIYYYGAGDTFSYYETTLAYSNQLVTSPVDFLHTYFGAADATNKSRFDAHTGVPLGYIFFNEKNLMVAKITLPLLFLGFKSYILTTLLVAVITYSGAWQLYRMFVRHYPHLKNLLAIAVLFMPSVIFWGSGILKDSYTLAATCFFISSTDTLINQAGNRFWSLLLLIFSGFVILAIKPYIIIILIPGTLVWYFYKRIKKIRNKLFRYLIIPMIYALVFLGSYGILTSLGGSLGKFSLENALKTAAVIQKDLKKEYYEGHSFNIGEFEPTFQGVASKFPIATISGLYRPFIWEAENMVMLLSALENLFILLITLKVLLTLNPKYWFSFLTDTPLLIYCLMFSILFAFMVGLTTPNYGALVRFKIPLIPLYMACFFILSDKRSLRENFEKRRKEKIELAY